MQWNISRFEIELTNFFVYFANFMLKQYTSKISEVSAAIFRIMKEVAVVYTREIIVSVN